MKTNLAFKMFTLAVFSGLLLAFAALAQAQGMQPAAATPPMGMNSQQQAILAETWTLTPQATARAGMPDLPLRICEGLYCGILAKMPLGAQVDILVNDREGWALVHVPSRSMYGWVNTNNILF